MSKKKNGSDQKNERIAATSEHEITRDVLPQNVINLLCQ